MRNLLGLIAAGLLACGGTDSTGSETKIQASDGCWRFAADGATGTLNIAGNRGTFSVQQGAFAAPNPPSTGSLFVAHEPNGDTDIQFTCDISTCGTTNGGATSASTRLLFNAPFEDIAPTHC